MAHCGIPMSTVRTPVVDAEKHAEINCKRNNIISARAAVTRCCVYLLSHWSSRGSA